MFTFYTNAGKLPNIYDIYTCNTERYIFQTNTDRLPTVTLTDLSKFGTSVNGEKIKNTELHDGDMIVFGNHSNFT